MLSISARSATPSNIRAYLEGERDGANRGAEDYYTESGRTPGRWLGSGAAELHLAGDVNEQAFDRLAAGFHPETDAPLVQRAGEHHRPGWDLTFSAPKSVSVVWGIAHGKQREAIERAHTQAVGRTLAFAEQQQLFVTRRGHNGIERETARPIIATYLHGTSREADPQLHTHAFVLNVTARDDGSHGTLETKPLYQWKMALGAAYRAELAQELRALGYETSPDSKGSFRLSHLPRDLERHFSRRRAQIEAVMNERGTTSAKAAEVAALNTRKAKESLGATTLRATWRSESLAFGVAAQHLADMAQHPACEIMPIPIQAVIEHLGREHSTFTSADLARAAAEHVQHAGGGLARTAEMMRRVANDTEIVPLAANRYTTREMLQIEHGALMRAKRLADDAAYRVDANATAAALKAHSLSEEQRSALEHLTAAPRLSVLEGLAGTGKSYLLAAARETWEASGYEVRAAALAGKAAKGLQDGSGIRSQTLHSLLKDLQTGRDRLNRSTVLVVDEAGMIGSRQFARLLEATDEAQAKIVLVGDANQLQLIEAGQLFERIGQEVGAARLTDIRRQRGAADRAMVRALASGDTRAALDSLQSRGRVHSAADRDNAMRQLVHDWAAARDSRNPKDDLMLGATRADTRELNRLARAALRERGELQHERVIEAAQGPLVLAEGDRIVITRNTKLLGTMNGDLATVTALTERRGEVEITAQLDEGRARTWRVRDHPHVEHGYALTVHKAQGASVERAYVLAHESMSAREWSYVAGSRAREAVHLYAERNTADDLARIMEHSHKKDTALDHLPATINKTSVAMQR
ncbi:MAG TPA: MobF family relaxase [Steroidobacteraceae bacterium]|jgi:Ti-type conjugative transfer relaxase TraA|nr:MobF family relaxase [Steroidobacteraceae bacterium]